MMEFKPHYKHASKAFITDKNSYSKLYNKSIQNSDVFWSEVAERISWFKKWDRVSDVDYSKAHINWWYKENENWWEQKSNN